ncbi:hypothetical protein JOD62_002865 [Microbacterium keratanolyticum]|nr:hypothetical protein [Microbacterium keratanolyticum]
MGPRAPGVPVVSCSYGVVGFDELAFTIEAAAHTCESKE